MRVKKNLSIEDNLLAAAEKKAKNSGLTFSAYMAMLILRDLNGEIVVEKTPQKKLDDNQRSTLSAILGDD